MRRMFISIEDAITLLRDAAVKLESEYYDARALLLNRLLPVQYFLYDQTLPACTC